MEGSVYGHLADLWQLLEKREQYYVLMVPGNEYVKAGFHLLLGAGEPRVHAARGVGTAVGWHGRQRAWGECLVTGRLRNRSVNCDSVICCSGIPVRTPERWQAYLVYTARLYFLQALLQVLGARWSIEDGFEEAMKEEGDWK